MTLMRLVSYFKADTEALRSVMPEENRPVWLPVRVGGKLFGESFEISKISVSLYDRMS